MRKIHPLEISLLFGVMYVKPNLKTKKILMYTYLQVKCIFVLSAIIDTQKTKCIE